MLGDLLRTARDRVGKSQAEVAAALGVSQPTISAWEGGRMVPHRLRWKRLAEVYELAFDAISAAATEEAA